MNSEYMKETVCHQLKKKSCSQTTVHFYAFSNNWIYFCMQGQINTLLPEVFKKLKHEIYFDYKSTVHTSNMDTSGKIGQAIQHNIHIFTKTFQ